MTTYHIQFTAEAPMQIGAGALGMIELSQCHVPGRVIWGALVNSFCQTRFRNPDDQVYQTVGKAIPKAGISTFFPLLPEKLDKPDTGCRHRFIPCFPCGKYLAEDKPDLEISISDVRATLLTSVTSTATTPLLMSATDQTLHSNDLIAPFLQLGRQNRLRYKTAFDGFLELPDEICVGDEKFTLDATLLEELFSLMRVGGGRKRGWGVIAPLLIEKRDSPYPGMESIPYKEARLLTREKAISPTDSAEGRAKLLSCREYDEKAGFGGRFSAAQMVWDIGTVLNNL